MKFFERLVLSQLKDIIEPLLDPLQFVCWANRLAKVAVNMGLHYILHYLNQPARILSMDLSSTFSTAIPDSPAPEAYPKGMFSPRCSSPTTLIATWENHL